MRTIVKFEEVLMFCLGIYLFSQLSIAWWWFIVLLLTPDISMFGYLLGNKAGAIIYNLFHHKAIAISIYIMGVYFSTPVLALIGVILFSHSSIDRALGYGLKYFKGFNYTHLGEIGVNNG